MPIASAELPEETWKAMQELADIRGAHAGEKIARDRAVGLKVFNDREGS